jgi:hypothetical protein
VHERDVVTDDFPGVRKIRHNRNSVHRVLLDLAHQNQQKANENTSKCQHKAPNEFKAEKANLCETETCHHDT